MIRISKHYASNYVLHAHYSSMCSLCVRSECDLLYLYELSLEYCQRVELALVMAYPRHSIVYPLCMGHLIKISETVVKLFKLADAILFCSIVCRIRWYNIYP